MQLRLALAASLLLGSAACGEDSPAIDVPDSVTSSTGGADTSTTTTEAPELAGASTSPVSTPPERRGLLRALRVAGQPGSDRIVFEFEGDLPGYEVRYVEGPITEDGSGDEVDIDGEAYLQIRMEPASGADLSSEEVREVYTGPRRVEGDTAVVEEVVRTGDFESVLTWVAGVRRRAPFLVTTLSSPNRLVIDVAIS